MLIRHDTNNIDVADILDNTDNIDPSLLYRTYVLEANKKAQLTQREARDSLGI